MDPALAGFKATKLKHFTLTKEGATVKQTEASFEGGRDPRESLYSNNRGGDHGTKDSLYEKQNRTRENMTMVRVIFRKRN